MRFSLVEVAGATHAHVTHGRGGSTFHAFHTDSRQATSGLFFALRGAEMDGHAFVADAVRRGATGVVVERPPGAVAATVFQVEDTWQALFGLAAQALRRVRPLVVAVTGSNGKTSTKEMLAAVLGTRHRVHRSQGNLNTETGVPLTLLGLEPDHEVLVLEMGMQGPGQIERLARLAQPRIGVVTNVGTVHMEFFRSREELARAKAELVQALPGDGRGVIPAEDEFCRLLSSLSAAPVTTFGLGAGDFRGEDYRPLPDGCAFTVRGQEVRLALPGRAQARNALAALAAGEAAGVALEDAAPALAGVRLGQRLEEIAAPGGFTILDDSYNASPESMLAAFEAAAERPRQGRLLAVLGEMRELGELAAGQHGRIGRAAAASFDEIAVIDTGHGRLLAEASGGQLLAHPAAAAAWVRSHVRPGDLVLIKGSRGVHLEQVVKGLTAEA